VLTLAVCQLIELAGGILASLPSLKHGQRWKMFDVHADLCLTAVSRHMPLVPYKFDQPSVPDDAFVAPSALVSGAVTVGKGSSVWYNAAIRGE
jgi:hypothetical protein